MIDDSPASKNDQPQGSENLPVESGGLKSINEMTDAELEAELNQ